MKSLLTKMSIIIGLVFIGTSSLASEGLETTEYIYGIDAQKILFDASIKTGEKLTVDSFEVADVKTREDGSVIVDESNYKNLILANVDSNREVARAFRKSLNEVDFLYKKCNQYQCVPVHTISGEDRRQLYKDALPQRFAHFGIALIPAAVLGGMVAPIAGSAGTIAILGATGASIAKLVGYAAAGASTVALLGSLNEHSNHPVGISNSNPHLAFLIGGLTNSIKLRRVLIDNVDNPDFDTIFFYNNRLKTLNSNEINKELEELFQEIGEPYSVGVDSPL